MPKKNVAFEEFMWPKFNNTGKDIIQWKMMDPPQRDPDTGEWMIDPVPDIIKPGERIVISKQKQFLKWILEYDEVGWFGIAAGMKSWCLLLSHVYLHLYWNARGAKNLVSGMFCESFKDLYRRQIVTIPKRIPEWLGEYNKTDFEFQFKKRFGGGKIMFCNLDDPDKYASAEFFYMTFDELTRNTRQTYDTVKSRLRWDDSEVSHCCCASAGNPGNQGTKWVYKRFVEQSDKDDMRIAYIFAAPGDNPFMGDKYQRVLGSLYEDKRKTLQEGRWDVFEGQFFDMLDDDAHLIPWFKIPDEIPKFFAIDHGTNHPTACMWGALYPPNKEFPRGRLIIYDYYEQKGKWADQHKKNIWALMSETKNVVSGVLGHDAFSSRGSTMGDKTVAERYNSDDEFGPSFNVVSGGGPGERKPGWRALLSALSYQFELVENDRGGVDRQIINLPQIQFMRTPRVLEAYRAMKTLVHKDGDPDDLRKVSGNVYEVFQGDESADTLRMLWVHIGAPEMYIDYGGSNDTPQANQHVRDLTPRHVDYTTML